MHHYFLTLINWGAPLRTIQRLKAKWDEALSNFAFNFNLRRYTKDWLDTLPAKVGRCRMNLSNPR
jgi:hypothetical protein